MAEGNFWIQHIEHDGELVDLSFLKKATLIETLDLSGPMLTMEFYDGDALLREDLGVAVGSVLDISMADYWASDENAGEIVDSYKVLTMPVVNQTVTVNCLQADIYKLKQPAIRSELHVNASVAALLRAFFPGVKQDIGAFPAGLTHHVLTGERPSKALRQVAAELGACVYYQRGTVFMHRLSDLLSAKSEFEYTYNDLRAERQIAHYTKPNAEYAIADKMCRRFCSWSMTDGMVWGDDSGYPAEVSSVDSATVLNNMAVNHMPVIDFTVSGSGAIRPGITLDLTWNLHRKDVPIDESLPEKVVVGTAAHFYQAQKYLTRIKGVLPVTK